jgi:hypothetical protein
LPPSRCCASACGRYRKKLAPDGVMGKPLDLSGEALTVQ